MVTLVKPNSSDKALMVLPLLKPITNFSFSFSESLLAKINYYLVFIIRNSERLDLWEMKLSHKILNQKHIKTHSTYNYRRASHIKENNDNNAWAWTVKQSSYRLILQ